MQVQSKQKGEGQSQRLPLNVLNTTIAAFRREPAPQQQPALGFFTDTSICIGCKACEVACKQWNQLPAIDPKWTGTSYDNTQQLSARTWRHVLFIEQVQRDITLPPAPFTLDLPLFSDQIAEAKGNGIIPETPPGEALPFFTTDRWLMHSDVCKHCANAPCQEACPTGAIIRTEFDTVYVQQDICNGCGYCVVACPFGVVARDEQGDHQAHKCTLCYDRLKDGMKPACAKACPTESIQFGEVETLKARARQRVGDLHERGVSTARLYGVDDTILDGGLNSFFLLLDEPEVYNLPQNPPRPSSNVGPASFWTALAATTLGIAGILFFRDKQ